MPEKVTSTFHNAGNIHLDVSGVAVIRSKDRRISFGQVKLMAVGSQKEEAFIFPGNLRDFVGVLERPLPQGEYIVDVNLRKPDLVPISLLLAKQRLTRVKWNSFWQSQA